MSTRTANPLIRVLPSLTDVAFIMPIVFLFVRLDGAKHLLCDGDTGWHVRTGEWILANGRVPNTDMFSFTKAGEPWFAWEWLWDVIFAWLHRQGGMAAVILASVLVISVTTALLYRLVRRKCGNAVIAIAVTIVAAAGSSMHWVARPHLFTLLFAVLFYSILERARDGRTRLLALLPLLTVAWTNLHGGFFVGIVIVGTYAAGEIAGWLFEFQPERRQMALARGKPYLLTALGCLAASLANPYFYHLHVYIYKFLNDSYAFKYIDEYQSLSFRHPLALYFEPMVLLGMAMALWSLYQKRFTYAFLLLGWAHLGLISIRNIPIYMVTAAPIIALTLQEWLLWARHSAAAAWIRKAAASAENLGAEVAETDRIGRIHLASAAALVLLAGLFYAPSPSFKFRAEYDPKKYPDKALAVLRGPESARSIFTDDEWGDYLIYRLYPNTKVFVDGRADFYGSKFNERYIDVMKVKYDWEQNLSRYGVDTILLPTDTALAGALKESRRWRCIYDDGIAVVFRHARRAPESMQVSAVHGNSGTDGDRKITQSENRDPKITKSNLRSEPI
jgi:hypothetical protein